MQTSTPDHAVPQNISILLVHRKGSEINVHPNDHIISFCFICRSYAGEMLLVISAHRSTAEGHGHQLLNMEYQSH